MDEHPRSAVGIIPRRSLKAADVVAALEKIIAEPGTAPTYARCDNGPEISAYALIDCCDPHWRRHSFHRPGIMWQNGFI